MIWRSRETDSRSCIYLIKENLSEIAKSFIIHENFNPRYINRACILLNARL
nr:MAG TPA: KALLIKREIN A [Caudoviricetes sp.]